MPEPTPTELTASLRDALDRVAELLGTSDRQGQSIELWERMWTELVPENAKRASELAEAIGDLGRPVSREEAADVAGVLRDLGNMLDGLTSDKAPNPDLIALYYLRRIDRRMEEFDQRLKERGI